MIDGNDLHYRIGDTTILGGIDISIRPGGITGILGANGAGKSTLLRLLSGSLTPSQGLINFDGQPLHTFDRRALAKRRAWMPQKSSGGDLLTVRQYVEIGRYCHRDAPPARHAQAISAALEQFDLQAMQDRSLSTLSGGERQRCDWALIWAQTDLQHEAKGKILMLDEPTAALDWGQAQRTFDTMQSARDRGATVIVVLHDLNLARLYCDEVVVLKDTRAKVSGDPLLVLDVNCVHECFGARVRLDATGRFLLPQSSADPP